MKEIIDQKDQKDLISFPKLRSLLSEITGNSTDEISLNTNLIDLGINLEDDLESLIEQINEAFEDEEVVLETKIVQKEITDEGLTVYDLAVLIDEEIELG